MRFRLPQETFKAVIKVTLFDCCCLAVPDSIQGLFEDKEKNKGLVEVFGCVHVCMCVCVCVR